MCSVRHRHPDKPRSCFRRLTVRLIRYPGRWSVSSKVLHGSPSSCTTRPCTGQRIIIRGNESLAMRVHKPFLASLVPEDQHIDDVIAPKKWDFRVRICVLPAPAKVTSPAERTTPSPQSTEHSDRRSRWLPPRVAKGSRSTGWSSAGVSTALGTSLPMRALILVPRPRST